MDECPQSRVKAGYERISVVFVRHHHLSWMKEVLSFVVRYVDACRKFDYFSDQNLAHCKNYLDESNIYFLGDAS